MNFRKANTSDIEILTQLRVEMLCENTNYSQVFKSLLYSNTNNYITDSIYAGSLISWVAENYDKIVSMGCINFFFLPPNDWCPNGKTAYIGNMYTIPTFRKQGLASKLLELLVNEAKNFGCQRILLNATDMGKPLYEKYGFETSPTAMAFYPFGIIPKL